LGYNKYRQDSDETSSESEQEEQLTTDLTDVSISSFVSNGERVWRPPEKIFSKRGQHDEKKRQSDQGAKQSGDIPASPRQRNSGGESSAGDPSSRRSSAADVPRLNFGGMLGQPEQANMEQEQAALAVLGSSRPPTPSIEGSPVMSAPSEPVLSARLPSSRESGRPQSLAAGESMASQRSIANNQQVIVQPEW